MIFKRFNDNLVKGADNDKLRYCVKCWFDKILCCYEETNFYVVYV